MGLLTALPWWWRIAAAMAIAAFGAYEMHKLDAIRYDALASEFQSYKAEAAANGKLAAELSKMQEQKQNEAENAIRQNLAMSNSNYAAVVKRLRAQSPKRPDGSDVPSTTCTAQGSSGSQTGELVPLTEYRALEERAAQDVQTIELYEAWAEQMAKAGAIQIK